MKKTLLILMAVAVVAVGCEGRQSYSAGSSKPSASNTSTPTELEDGDRLNLSVVLRNEHSGSIKHSGSIDTD